jgi:hypothetical protein
VNRRVLAPLLAGVVAFALAGLVAWWTWGHGTDDGTAAAAPPSGAATPALHRIRSRAGDFSLGVPAGLNSRVEKGTAYLSSADKTLVLLVSRSEPGGL